MANSGEGITTRNSKVCTALETLAQRRASSLDSFRVRAEQLPDDERVGYLQELDEQPVTLDDIHAAWKSVGYSERAWTHAVSVASAWHTFGGWTIVTSAQAGALPAEAYAQEMQARRAANQRAFVERHRTDWTRGEALTLPEGFNPPRDVHTLLSKLCPDLCPRPSQTA